MSKLTPESAASRSSVPKPSTRAVVPTGDNLPFSGVIVEIREIDDPKRGRLTKFIIADDRGLKLLGTATREMVASFSVGDRIYANATMQPSQKSPTVGFFRKPTNVQKSAGPISTPTSAPKPKTSAPKPIQTSRPAPSEPSTVDSAAVTEEWRTSRDKLWEDYMRGRGKGTPATAPAMPTSDDDDDARMAAAMREVEEASRYVDEHPEAFDGIADELNSLVARTMGVSTDEAAVKSKIAAILSQLDTVKQFEPDEDGDFQCQIGLGGNVFPANINYSGDDDILDAVSGLGIHPVMQERLRDVINSNAQIAEVSVERGPAARPGLFFRSIKSGISQLSLDELAYVIDDAIGSLILITTAIKTATKNL